MTGDTDDELIWINPSVLFEIDPLTATASELFMLGNSNQQLFSIVASLPLSRVR